MNSITPFVYGVLTTWLVHHISTCKVLLSYSYIMEDKYVMSVTMRNYKNATLVNKETLENMGYAIDMKNEPGWFFKNRTELSISKNNPASYVEEYDLLKKAMHDSDFHMTHIEDDKVKVLYYHDRSEKSD